MQRRSFIGGILAAGMAPAYVKAGILMPVRKIVVPPSWQEVNALIRASYTGYGDILTQGMNTAKLPDTVYWVDSVHYGEDLETASGTWNKVTTKQGPAEGPFVTSSYYSRHYADMRQALSRILDQQSVGP